MNRTPLIHNNITKKDLIKKYFIALIPLIIFSIYKNGLLLYQNDLINISKVFIPIYFYLISILIGLIISCSISINTNMLIYPVLLFVSLFISKVILNKFKFKYNVLSLSRIILILALLLNVYSYLNIAEKLGKFNYNYFDLFIGHGIGGLANTSLLILIFSLIILCSNKYYKKIIPLTSSLSFIIITIVYILITKDYNHLNILLNGFNYFSFIFIAPDIYITPVCKEGMFLYGLLIGILTSILNLCGITYEASFISIFIFSLSIHLINKINNKKYFRN